LGRVTSAPSTVNGWTQTVTWTYDGASAFGIGRPSTMTDPAGSSAYAYERRGLLTTENRTYGGATYATTYQYDANGNRAKLGYPSGTTATYTFDFADRPLTTTVGTTPIITSTSYLPFGPMAAQVFGNGTTKTMTFDNRYRVTENKLTGPAGVMADSTYTEDAAGNIMSIHDVVDPTYNRDFGYDDLSRLTTANTGSSLWGTGGYTYDAMGNMLSQDLGGLVEVDPNQSLSRKSAFTARPNSMPAPGSVHERYTYVGTTPKLDKVTTIQVVNPGIGAPPPAGIDHPVFYDATGNESHYVVERLYSPRNLMVSVNDFTFEGMYHIVQYEYDGRGVRVKRNELPTPTGSVNRWYFYSPDLHLLTSTTDDGANPWSKRSVDSIATSLYDIVWLGDLPVAQIDAAGTRYTFTDHLGTPTLQTSASATVVWRAEYEPYGNLYKLRVPTPPAEGTPAPPPLIQPLRFPGQEVAMTWEGREENYNIFRWYRAGWGRYTQADPIGLAGNLNLFVYGGDSPGNQTDQLGLKCCRPSRLIATRTPVVAAGKSRSSTKSVLTSRTPTIAASDSESCKTKLRPQRDVVRPRPGQNSKVVSHLSAKLPGRHGRRSVSRTRG
jgi:RHS repeat-associated protein